MASRPDSAWHGLLGFLKQRRAERTLRQRNVHFRITDAARVANAYREMSTHEFDIINGPQEWQNRRIIPGMVQSLGLTAPVLAIDLGCGSGQSSQVLASQLPHGSRLLGYDLCTTLLDRARQRRYRDAAGSPIEPSFVQQSIAGRLHDANGRALPDASVGLAHSAGVVGHHLSEADVNALADELGRVVAPHGHAILDAGPAMPHERLQRILAQRGFQLLDRRRAVPCASHRVLMFRRR